MSLPELSNKQQILKRSFDLLLSLFGLISFFWLILLAWLILYFVDRENGFFLQERIGRFGKVFYVIKLRTMRVDKNLKSTVTCSTDPRITKFGSFLRRTKIDELPQLWNVLRGEMSLVGPRPDVSGFADKLEGFDRIILNLRPGITGPASLKYRNEELLLAQQDNPEKYNMDVIWPDKVRINIDYIKNWSFKSDLLYIIKTFLN